MFDDVATTQRSSDGDAKRKAFLARLGFTDTAAALGELDALESSGAEWSWGILDAVGDVGDPDLALRNLTRLWAALPGNTREALAGILGEQTPGRRRLLRLLGFSGALADHLARHPEHWRDVVDATARGRPTADQTRHEMVSAVGANPDLAEPVADGEPAAQRDVLRVAYRRHLLAIVALDLTGDLDVAEVAAELADVADATLEAALAIARAELPDDAMPCRLAIIGMGKCGGRELNYASDVDVVFVAEPVSGDHDENRALSTASTLAGSVMRICSDHTGEGTIWPVDAALRPEGKNGPLVRTVPSHVTYYEQWAKTWEFQALLKARPVAGDRALGQSYIDAVEPMVWSAGGRDHFVDDVRSMRQRVEDAIRPADVDRQLKLGPGGLRDVEFAVQLLQLVHGRTDPAIRSASTITALGELIAGGYVGREDGATLDHAYRFLRTLEHRIQLRRLRRTHLVPDAESDLRILARSLDMKDPQTLVDGWRREAREVRRLHEKLFYRPLLSAVAGLAEGQAQLSAEAALDRLQALGYSDPRGALRHLEALTRGVSRRAAIQRTLLPVLLGWFADAPEPDIGLAGFRKVSDALGTTHWYLRLLRDDNAAAERMAKVLATGRYATELLLRSPDAVAVFGDDEALVPRGRAAIESEMCAAVRRHDDPETAVGVIRSIRRRELFRITVADIIGALTIEQVGEALTDVAEATLAGALQASIGVVSGQRRTPLPTRLAVIAMGRLGGREMGYASDADVLFVHAPSEGADEEDAADAAIAVASEMGRMLSQPSQEPALTLDAGLRPEGRQGPLVRTLRSYSAYYERWGEVWERQALLRAAPATGDPELLRRFEALIDAVRWPAGGLTDEQVLGVRRIKARVESERLPRGVEPTAHLKLGPGGLADVEWCIQLLQLRHAGAIPSLRTTSTVAAIDAAADEDLISRDDREALLSAWRLASLIRNATVMVTGRPSDALPRDPLTLASIARVLGYGPGESTVFLDDYRRATRHARTTFEHLFYDD